MKVDVKWQEKFHFVGQSADGHQVNMDPNQQGPTPMELLLMAIAGCTGVDVVSILGKMEVPIEDLQIGVEGERADDHPKVFTKINIVYNFKGKDLPLKKLERAVSLSMEKYCSVSNNLKGIAQVTYTINTVG